MNEKKQLVDPEVYQENIKTLPKEKLTSYNYPLWSQILRTVNPHVVHSAHTLRSLLSHFEKGEQVEFTISGNPTISILNAQYDFRTEDQENTYQTGEPGERSATFQVKETNHTIKLKLSSVEVTHDRNGLSQDTWVVTGYTSQYHEYNYNAGSEMLHSKYVITKRNNRITYEQPSTP